MSRINVARLGGWRAVSINLSSRRTAWPCGQLHATEAGGVALVAQACRTGPTARASPRAVRTRGGAARQIQELRQFLGRS